MLVAFLTPLNNAVLWTIINRTYRRRLCVLFVCCWIGDRPEEEDTILNREAF